MKRRSTKLLPTWRSTKSCYLHSSTLYSQVKVRPVSSLLPDQSQPGPIPLTGFDPLLRFNKHSFCCTLSIVYQITTTFCTCYGNRVGIRLLQYGMTAKRLHWTLFVMEYDLRNGFLLDMQYGIASVCWGCMNSIDTLSTRRDDHLYRRQFRIHFIQV